ncbi:O-antigen ligase family protein [Candidatus Ruminimicrobium bovinum]|uniref:O-antigen ligase family protein n=1 Tax=Candidatus Ruminimicrobium bovinum TaxID=3242779 RepID=UPI0039B87705
MGYFPFVLFSFILFFAPLSFALTEPWALLISQCLFFFLLIELFFRRQEFYFTPVSKKIIFCFIIVLLLCVIQYFNPHTILEKKLYLPFSLCPFYTFTDLSNILLYMFVFFIANQNFENSDIIKKLLLIIVISSAIVLFIGFSCPKGEYIKTFLGAKVFGSFGPFVNRNNAGAFLAMSLFTTLSLLFHIFVKQSKNTPLKFIFIALSILFLIGVVFTRSRGAMLATFISLFALFILSGMYLIRDTKKSVIAVCVTIFLFSVFSYFIYIYRDSINEFASRKSVDDFSTQARIDLYNSAFKMLKEYPLTGTGVAAFPVAIGNYQEMNFSGYPNYLHNDWLELLLGIGYPAGLIIFLLIILTVYIFLKNIKNLRHSKRALYIPLLCSLLSVSIASSVDFHLHIPANAILFFTILAILSSATFFKEDISYFKSNIFIKTFFIAAFSVIIVFSAKNTVIWRWTIFGNKLSIEGKISSYEKAVAYSANPRYAIDLGIEYIKAQKSKVLSDEQKQEYKNKAKNLAMENLQKYPFEKRFSQIYTAAK